MRFPTPYDRFEGEVRPEWIDLNGHMNLAYYTVLFDYATDLLFDELDLGRRYRERTDLGTFVIETHNRYERELLVGERVRVTVQILSVDDKRLHLAHEMFRGDTGERAATQELLFLHVSLRERRVTPFPAELKARLDAAAAAHAVLGRPAWVGRHVGMPR
ncbi:MAG TPA: thioesterase family protein [Stellaceae bacterium]|nr:thioesterase family protein [Stellaceae bacterium]